VSFPESERIVFEQNPLAEVICQLTFPTILAIAAESPSGFQELIREHYPIYERAGLNLPPGASEIISQFPIPIGIDIVTHRFLTEDRSCQVALNRDFIAVTVNNYERWEDFQATLGEAKTAFENAYRPAFYTRLGLRYRDVVDRESLGLGDRPWSALINPSVLGLLGAEADIQRGIKAIRGEVIVELDEPPGAAVKLSHGLGDQKEGGQSYVVDADWFVTGRNDPGEVMDVLGRINRQAGDLFRWAITPELRNGLGSRDD
jgi:uncharacterized protein (TIGR04255 family)